MNESGTHCPCGCGDDPKYHNRMWLVENMPQHLLAPYNSERALVLAQRLEDAP